MQNIIKNGVAKRRLIQNCQRSYTTYSIPLNEPTTATTTTTNVNSKSNSIIQSNSSTINEILSNLPSKNLIDSYRLSSVFASNIRDTKEKQIKHQLIILAEQKNINKLSQLLETWSANDLNGMIETLGRDLISEYLNLIIHENKNEVITQYTSVPINKSARSLRLSDKLNKSGFHMNSQLTKQVRNIYKNIIYSNKRESLYGKEKRNDIYNSQCLTGYRLTTKDFTNLMELELSNLKLDLASRWFRLFRMYNENWQDLMTPEMWKLAFKIDGYGDNRIWTLKGSDLSNYYKYILRGRFEPSMELSIKYLQDQIEDFDLEMHSIVIHHLAYKGQIDVLKKYVESIWGINSEGNLVAEENKLNTNHHLYPDLKFLTALFASLAFNGDFFSGIKYINNFQTVYDEIIESDSGKKVFWEQVFKWADISTMFEEEKALRFFLNKSNYSRGNDIKLEDAKNDVNFDYEGYLQFIEKLRNERYNTFDQIWKIIQKDPPISYSSFIYKVYLDILKEQNDESRIFDYLNRLLFEYERHHVDGDSFTKRSGMGFVPTNDKELAIEVLYLEAMKYLIDLKGENTYIGQIFPLIEKYSIDKSMKHNLKTWVRKERLNKYRKILEGKREKFMNDLANDDDNESLLELM
ncbi:uncharacterized protein KGF55_003900 [Candida pseudojiufengensis]|uniref:uncharacterized protein n=1 Tax=Candida pseudojiufengensis TaxID=497109 RepID=UPI0022247C88|nr:uncharacterized protein KGF55_003900 [Candida pseudojiufengensis]KAI5961583.1 hypothetical protein KGF55_003900 [Candida pseudojiufengensis]